MYKYPYGDSQQLNLDWILAKLKELEAAGLGLDLEEVSNALIALTYNPDTLYARYDYAFKDNKLYRCLTGTTGAFDQAAWQEALIGDDLAVLTRWINAIDAAAVVDVKFDTSGTNGKIQQKYHDQYHDVVEVDYTPVQNSKRPLSSNAGYELNGAIKNEAITRSKLNTKNLLIQNGENSTTKADVIFTKNADGTITVNGTASATAFFEVTRNVDFGNAFITSESNEGQAINGYIMTTGIGGRSDIALEYNRNNKITAIKIVQGTTYDNLVVYPMIRYATDIDNTFQKYIPTNDELNGAINAIKQAGSIITVGTTNCNFTTISAAIARAREIIAETNKNVLIQLAPETFNEEIVLNPNPGISFIGYGATIETASTYPNAPLYTVGGHGIYFVGITFHQTNSSGQAYGCHIEAQNVQTYIGGNTYFIDCTFVSTAHAGLGMGLGAGLFYRFINCDFFTTATGGVALYTHNHPLTQSSYCQAAFYNCSFHGIAGDISIVDSARINGRNNVSQYAFIFQKCAGDTHIVRVQVNDTDTYTSIKEATTVDTNFILGADSLNNISIVGVDDKWGYFNDAVIGGTMKNNRFVYHPPVPPDFIDITIGYFDSDGTYSGFSQSTFGMCKFINVQDASNITQFEALLTVKAI